MIYPVAEKRGGRITILCCIGTPHLCHCTDILPTPNSALVLTQPCSAIKVTPADTPVDTTAQTDTPARRTPAGDAVPAKPDTVKLDSCATSTAPQLQAIARAQHLSTQTRTRAAVQAQRTLHERKHLRQDTTAHSGKNHDLRYAKQTRKRARFDSSDPPRQHTTARTGSTAWRISAATPRQNSRFIPS